MLRISSIHYFLYIVVLLLVPETILASGSFRHQGWRGKHQGWSRAHPRQAKNCLQVVLTGTQTGPAITSLTGPGTLVTYGTVENNCRDTVLQIDVGRGTSTQLAALGLAGPAEVDAVFFTHMHADHIDDMPIFMFNRWLFNRPGKIDVACSKDAPSPAGFTISCRKFMESIAGHYFASGEINQRQLELPNLDPGGPAAMANMILFENSPSAPRQVWSNKAGDVTVEYITSNHIAGHASYRINTPAGKVVVGGDASNDEADPTKRSSSTSVQVEKIATGSDILVHTAVHPILAPGGGSTAPPPLYFRQSNVIDLGAMAQRAGVSTLMLTHLAPGLGRSTVGPFTFPGPPLGKKDFRKAAREGGFRGRIVVGIDGARVTRYAY